MKSSSVEITTQQTGLLFVYIGTIIDQKTAEPVSGTLQVVFLRCPPTGLI
jgi:hypothetical protein